MEKKKKKNIEKVSALLNEVESVDSTFRLFLFSFFAVLIFGCVSQVERSWKVDSTETTEISD